MENLKKNMLWNAAGNLIYLGCQWLVTVLVTNLGQFHDAGILSVAMSVSATFQTVAMFGIRNFQVSDVEKKYSDTCYVGFRTLTCGAAMLACILFSLITGYRGEQLLSIFLFMLFRLAENFSDVLHGIAQKNGRLDVAGKSFAIKGVGLLAVFLAGYKLSANLCVGLACMAFFSCATTLLYDLFATRKLSQFGVAEKGTGWLSLARETAPLCVYLFLSSAITTLPKLILEKQCGEEVLGAYASIFAPALLISAAAGYLYTPFIPHFAKTYHEGNRKDFFKTFCKISVGILAFAALALFVATLLGDFILQLIFGEKIDAYVYLLVPILISIFVYAYFCFLCMLGVVLRDFVWLLIAGGMGLLTELLMTSRWISATGINATSYSFILASAVASSILACRIFLILFRKPKKELSMDVTNLHTFVLCAYRESAYLEECVKSLLAQTVRSKVLISTSTPNAVIDGVARKYGLPVYINEGERGITGDWNFGFSLVDTPFVTIAHQDDIYEPTYTETMLKRAQGSKKPILIFSEYFEIRNGQRVYKNRLLQIKRLMNIGYRLFPAWRWARLRVLSVGNSICCPAVTYSTAACEGFCFDGDFKFACDWDAWDRLARQKGAFLYIPEPLVGHRIHEESETTKQTAGEGRSREEYLMFRRYWPNAIARRLAKFYAKGADSNEL